MHHRVLLITCVFLAVTSSADARKWTDVAGNEVNAEYVRIHEGEVILRQGSRVIKCPYDQFSEIDKAYIRDQMGDDREKSKRRSGLNQIGGPVAPEATDDDAHELRTWSDLQGKKILAQYTGFSRDEVELIKDGKRFSYPYLAFSPADQMYVSQILIAEGRADEIPKKKQEGQEEQGSRRGRPGGASRGESDYGENDAMGAGHMPSAPDYEVMNSGGPSFDGGGSQEPEYGMGNMGSPNHSPPINHSPFPSPNTPSIPRGPSYSGPEMTQRMVWSCTNCRKELPASVGAGDNCPHCHAYLNYEEQQDGSKKYAGAASWNNHRLIIRLGILGFFVVMGALAALFRR